MKTKPLIFGLSLAAALLAGCAPKDPLVLSCRADNDLFGTLRANGIACRRFETPRAAVDHARKEDAVMILADGYPEVTTPVDEPLFERARRKRLRLYVEYPAYLPGSDVGAPRGTYWERAVISSDSFSPDLPRLRIIAIHDCHFVPMKVADPDIVAARVAGFDTAVFGLPDETFPILGELAAPGGKGSLMVSSTKLSQFVTARYAPAEAWTVIWRTILGRLRPGGDVLSLKWTPSVRPSFERAEVLPADIEKTALDRGIGWFFRSGLILSPALVDRYRRPANLPVPAPAEPVLAQDWPYGHRIAKLPANLSRGDGSLGIMEGYDSTIFADGTQPVRWWNRGDCNGEVAGAMGLAGRVFGNPDYQKTAANIGDWLFFKSMISLGDRANPGHAAFGLSGWNDVPEYCGPGTMDGYGVYYGDDNARVVLGMMLAASAQRTERYDRRLAAILLANLRTSGVYGFERDRVDQAPLVKAGWQGYFRDKNTSFSPHYQAYMWACYLWAYRHTGFRLFLERARTAVAMTMAAYPDRWQWANGIQQERARMLLPLAWLIRVEDTPEHRGWLRKMASDLLAGQDGCGAIREALGEAGKGGFPPPASNEAYGTSEAPLIQTNGDGASDLLYTTNFAFLGLHEAAAATGDRSYSDAEEKLAAFLCRIQVRSATHPELDGGWFRAFDFNRWEYWASSGDAGWGAWSIESGWTQSWITAVLGLRQMRTSVWEITEGSRLGSGFAELRRRMIPDAVLASLPGTR